MIGMKQKWLCEVVTQHSLQNRESYWLLTYLLEHETILKTSILLSGVPQHLVDLRLI